MWWRGWWPMSAKLARDPAVVEKAERAGYEWIGAGPDALRQKMAEEVAQSQEVIRFSGHQGGVSVSSGCWRSARYGDRSQAPRDILTPRPAPGSPP